MKDKIKNARRMADNIHKTPASEQTIGAIAAFTEQAIRDLADVVESLLPANDEAPADPGLEVCEQCNAPLQGSEHHAGGLVFCSPQCHSDYLAK